MVKFFRKKKRLFDDGAYWVPPKGRAFKLKASTDPPTDRPTGPPTDAPTDPPSKDRRPLTDSEGLDKAYADPSNRHLDSQGTLYVAGTKGNFFQNKWLENYKTMGVPLLKKC